MHRDAPLRRFTIWSALLGYALVASGLPLPCGVVPPAASDSGVAKRLGGKDRTRPFPCMDKPCGCDTADRCFTNCCCHTPAETLAWARARGVEIDVLATLERRAAMASPAGTEKGSCCSTTPTAGCREQEAGEQAVVSSAGRDASGASRPSVDRAAASSCCEGAAPVGGADDAVAVDSGAAERASSRRTRTVSLRAMLACGGIVAEWFAAGAALPPPTVGLSHVLVPIGRSVSADVTAAGLRAPPEPPPPRAA